ncbi:hypothetical protein ACIB24_15870 [Spongisporangium articulatum]|uniref:Uncharacterized protein n=1 Tax=Spongisporangium articulatum TaxID=3362603 RepID=A0ABW8ARN5_9ACTN
MAKRWRPAPNQGLLSCPAHGKSVYRTQGAALAAARDVEVREGLEPGAMSYYACPESKGWHIGHRSIRDRLDRSR